MPKLYVIDCRKPDGSLCFAESQPESFFGMSAITGITDDEMAKKIYAKLPDSVLDGRELLQWPQKIDPRWTARVKYW